MVGFPDGSVVTNLPAVQDSWVHPLIGKFSEEEIAINLIQMKWTLVVICVILIGEMYCVCAVECHVGTHFS